MARSPAQLRAIFAALRGKGLLARARALQQPGTGKYGTAALYRKSIAGKVELETGGGAGSRAAIARTLGGLKASSYRQRFSNQVPGGRKSIGFKVYSKNAARRAAIITARKKLWQRGIQRRANK